MASLEMLQLNSRDADFSESLQALLDRSHEQVEGVEEVVEEIINDVRQRGNQALLEYTRRFDRMDIAEGAELELSPERLQQAVESITEQQREALDFSISRVREFHQRQSGESWSYTDETGTLLGQQVTPLDRVGVYVPGGKAAYPSSVLMSAVPARVAGVKEITMVSPRVSAHVLAAAKIAGVNRIYRVGGAQAIAALAYGTETIGRVDKIVGPGNIYVETAKRLVFGVVGLDMVAGPSEVLIVADESGSPAFAAADFIAQAEHDEDAFPIIITTSESFLHEVEQEIHLQVDRVDRKEIVQKSIQKNGLLILAHTLDVAIELSNRVAPEHLELMVENAADVLDSITNAGAVFVGNYSPVAAGDYMAGPSHVLPTAGTARFFSPLGVFDFLKRMSVINFSKEELKNLYPAVSRLAQLEGLDAHAKAMEVRVLSKE